MKTMIKALHELSEKDFNHLLDTHTPIPFPTETVFGLGAAFDDEIAISNVYQLKGRPQDNPLIVHISRVDMLLDVVEEITVDAKKLMDAFFPGPLTIVLKKHPNVSPLVTAFKETVAFRMPAHDVAVKLIDRIGKPIVAPSANLSGKPSATKASHVYDDFKGKLPMIIGGSSSKVGIESTIVDLSRYPYTILRPGHITKQALINVLGNVFDGKSDVIAPGMIHPHYEPKHPLYILRGRDENIISYMKKKDRMVFMGDVRFLSQLPHMISLGSSVDDMKSMLYDALRHTDLLDIDIIYTHEIDDEGYMNRLLKAAQGKIIDV